ncbi:MAG: apolipoprotein N-acyltransferase [Parachlamydiaceae bacterium]
MHEQFRLKSWQKKNLFVLSFFIVAFGQPAWIGPLGLIASIGGFAGFWRVLLEICDAKKRFILGMGWYTAVQVVQLSWFLSHPYLYIYAVMLFCAVLMGIQWGFLSIWIQPKICRKIPLLFAIAGCWILLEWSRLFLLSGLPFNPVGLTLTGSIYSLQLAAFGGVYGLSFWVMLTNLFLLRAWIDCSNDLKWGAVVFFVLFPFVFGWAHLTYHENFFNKDEKYLKVVLVQSGLPIEENMQFQSAEEVRQFILDEWRHVLSTLKKQVGKSIDLIVFPENLVPYGTFHHVFPIEEVIQLFQGVFRDLVIGFPNEDSLLIERFSMNETDRLLVSNAYLAQTVANFFHADVMIGLEDSTYKNQRKAHSYSSAFHFIPDSADRPERYEKRVLVPMGEYIPFEWCRTLAARYGVTGSFTCGTSAKVFDGPIPFGASICYEEMYGHLMRENKMKGAELLVNLTNDGWYPHSRLPKQHFDHARLRSIENGIPLVRACNTGVTGAVDSLGRLVGILAEYPMQEAESADSLYLDVPLYHYATFYSQYGDYPVIALSLIFLVIGICIHAKLNFLP